MSVQRVYLLAVGQRLPVVQTPAIRQPVRAAAVVLLHRVRHPVLRHAQLVGQVIVRQVLLRVRLPTLRHRGVRLLLLHTRPAVVRGAVRPRHVVIRVVRQEARRVRQAVSRVVPHHVEVIRLAEVLREAVRPAAVHRVEAVVVLVVNILIGNE